MYFPDWIVVYLPAGSGAGGVQVQWQGVLHTLKRGLFRQSDKLTMLEDKLDNVEDKLEGKLDKVEEKLDKAEAKLTDKLDQLEGALLQVCRPCLSDSDVTVGFAQMDRSPTPDDFGISRR